MVVMTVLVELTIQFFLQKPSSSYWKHYELKEYSDSITTVFIGPSRTFNSVDPDIVDKYLDGFSFNAGSVTQRFSQGYYVVKDCINNCENMSCLCVEVNGLDDPLETIDDDAIKVAADIIVNPIIRIECILDNLALDEYPSLFFSTSSLINIYDSSIVRKNVSIKLSTEYRQHGKTELFSDSYYSGRGFSPCRRVMSDKVYDSINAKETFTFGEKSFDYLNKIINICKENNIAIVFYSTPRPDRLIRSNLDFYATCYNKYAQIARYNDIGYYDFNLYKGKADLLDDRVDYVDSAHLNDVGSKKFSALIGEIVQLDLDGQDCSDRFFSSVYDCVKPAA